MMQDYYLYILPASIALFWIVRIFLSKDTNKAQLFIAGGMLMALLSLFFGGEFALFMFPLFHMAVRQKTSPGGVNKWDLLILLPSILLVPYTDTIVFTIYLCIQITAITIWSVISVRRYNRRLAEIYDSSSEMSADDISQVLTFVIFTVIIIMIELSLPDFVTASIWINIVLTLFITVLQFLIGYYTFRMKDTSSIAAELSEVTDDIREDSTVQEVTDDDLIRKVISDELYLDPTISLVSLAERLGTNRTYLSASIHACRKQNFSDFINSLRISRFIEIASSEGSLTNIKDAATRSGYSNLQSFYRNFSEIMQMTPKAWMAGNENKVK